MNVTIATEDSCHVFYTQSLDHSTLPHKGDVIRMSGEPLYEVIRVDWWLTRINEFDVKIHGVEVVVEIVSDKPKKPWWKIWP
jgi:hypothetical protein